MEKIKALFAHRFFKILKWAFLVLVLAYFVLVGFRIVHFFNLDKTNAQVAKIHATKLTLDDVMGTKLPSDPGTEADKTIAGFDTNNNGIRDDVEIAIFKEYPNSAKTRAVLLQYALALQMETVQPFINTIIATEVIREQSRGYQCVGKALIRDDNNKDIMNQYFQDGDKLRLFIEDRQYNTKERKDGRNNFVELVRSYSDLDQGCDIDITKLPN